MAEEVAASSALVTDTAIALGAGRSTSAGPVRAPSAVEASSPVAAARALFMTPVMAGPSHESSGGLALGGFDEGATWSDTRSSLASMAHALLVMADDIQGEILPTG